MGQTYARSVEAGVFCGDAAVVVAGAGDGVREHAPVEIVAIRQTTMNARRMINCTVACGLIACGAARARAHDPSSVPITWNREISRVVYDRCASCHRPGGTAFSLMTYKDAQPRADAIRAAVMSRQMPPWGAVQGFGDFNNSTALTQEQIALVADWVEGGAPRGNNPNALPPAPKFEPAKATVEPRGIRAVSGDVTLPAAVTLIGLLPEHVPDGASMQIVAVLPDRSVKPLLWLYQYRDAYKHPFLFREPMRLPSGTHIRGVSGGARILLIGS